jgi:succinyl-diaminopimelate desuccinylase
LLAEAPRLERRLRRLCRPSRHLRPPTVTPTIVRSPLHGPPQANVIPSAAEATLDIRLTPGPDEDAIAAEIDRTCRAAARRAPGTIVEWQAPAGFRLATQVSRREPLVAAMAEAVRQVRGESPVFGGVPGSTDGTILRMVRGIPIVTCGPGARLIPHQVDEHVKVSELAEAARIYVASALNFLNA